MRTRHLVFGIAASVALVTACGSSDDGGSDTTVAVATSAAGEAATTEAAQAGRRPRARGPSSWQTARSVRS